MRHRATVCGLIAIFLTTAQPAFAKNDKGDDDRHDRGRNKHAQRHDRGDHEAQAPQRWRHTGRTYRFEGRDERGAGPGHQFHRGDRISHEYRQRYYVVNDWRGHRLSAPPRGYYWVQTGGDYVLVAIATGIIVDLLLNH